MLGIIVKVLEVHFKSDETNLLFMLSWCWYGWPLCFRCSFWIIQYICPKQSRNLLNSGIEQFNVGISKWAPILEWVAQFWNCPWSKLPSKQSHWWWRSGTALPIFTADLRASVAKQISQFHSNLQFDWPAKQSILITFLWRLLLYFASLFTTMCLPTEQPQLNNTKPNRGCSDGKTIRKAHS